MGKYALVYSDPLLASVIILTSLKIDVPQGSVIGALCFATTKTHEKKNQSLVRLWQIFIA